MPTLDVSDLERPVLWKMEWYVYKCWDDGILRWIGHGKGDRVKYHTGVQPRVRLLFADPRSRKEIIEFGLSKQEAIEIEADLILTIGREDLCWGPLWNLTNGPGLSGNILSEKRLSAIRERMRSNKSRQIASQRMIGKKYGFGYKHTENAKRKIGNSSKGNTNTKGNLWITDGKVNKQLKPGDKIPSGWRFGIKKEKTVKGKIWITNTTENKYILLEDKIPVGWQKGFTSPRIYVKKGCR